MKNYNEIAANVFKRRDEYIAKQRTKKRIIATVAPTLCFALVLALSFTLFKSGFFNNKNTAFNDINSEITHSQNETDNDTISQNTDSSHEHVSSNPKDNSSQNEFINSTDNSSSSVSDTPSNDTTDTPSNNEDTFVIDSIDKMNFYSAKKILNENSLFPFFTSKSNTLTTPFLLNTNTDLGYFEYPIDKYKVFTTTMVTYFNIELNDERGFLAQKLGGTGTVEVVVTHSDIDDAGGMITFKREDKYYSCISNGASYDNETNMSSQNFSTHKYIDGFNIVKNFNQDNYKFIVHYEGSKVIGFECMPMGDISSKYKTDNVNFVEDYCTVLFTKQTFTIDQLELYFKNNNVGDLL